jgi:hypothetical protein
MPEGDDFFNRFRVSIAGGRSAVSRVVVELLSLGFRVELRGPPSVELL